MAWIRGLKTTYYLRALSATSAEKSTLDRGTLNAVSSAAATPAEPAAAAPAPAIPEVQQAPVVQAAAPVALDIDLDLSNAAPVPLACSLDDPDCEACQ